MWMEKHTKSSSSKKIVSLPGGHVSGGTNRGQTAHGSSGPSRKRSSHASSFLPLKGALGLNASTVNGPSMIGSCLSWPYSQLWNK